MKIITLVPVKNEAWVLPYSLKNFSSFSDYVIVADQNSTDETVSICSTFKKVKVIKNPYQAHTNQIRWLLLDEARKIAGNNLIIYLDADELISPDVIGEIKKKYDSENRALVFSAQWVQLFNSYNEYRVDGVWKNNYKQFAFIDDRVIDYDRTTITNDHSSRVPAISDILAIESPILHLQYLAKKRCEIKQIFYMCTELLQGASPRRVNHQYSVAKFSDVTQTARTPAFWFHNIELPPVDIFSTEDTIKKNQVYKLFNEKGVLFFEHLDIWDNEEFKKFFFMQVGRMPMVRKFPKIIVVLNEMKNRIKNAILAKLKRR